MATIKVAKAFSLNFKGARHQFDVGVHEVEDEIAAHWYTKAHADVTDSKPAPAPAPVEQEGDAEVKTDEAAPVERQKRPYNRKAK